MAGSEKTAPTTGVIEKRKEREMKYTHPRPLNLFEMECSFGVNEKLLPFSNRIRIIRPIDYLISQE